MEVDFKVKAYNTSVRHSKSNLTLTFWLLFLLILEMWQSSNHFISFLLFWFLSSSFIIIFLCEQSKRWDQGNILNPNPIYADHRFLFLLEKLSQFHRFSLPILICNKGINFLFIFFFMLLFKSSSFVYLLFC
jgi:hypothetical protein